MSGLRESTMAPADEIHLLTGAGLGISFPVLIEINALSVSLTVENFPISLKMKRSSADRKGTRKITGRLELKKNRCY